MRKFTIFTLILTVIVVVAAADIVVNKYLPGMDEEGEASFRLRLPDSLDLSKITQTNTLGNGLTGRLSEEAADVDASVDTPAEDSEADELPTNIEETPTERISRDSITQDEPEDESDLDLDPFLFGDGFEDLVDETSVEQESDEPEDFEDAGYISTNYAPNVFLRQEQVKSAGFKDAYLESEDAEGMLFKSVEVADLFDVEIEKTAIRGEDAIFAKVYVLRIGPNSSRDDVYNVLKARARELPGVSVNESNSYGLGSFYINDTNRGSTAFLTVKIGGVIYGFSYPKEFHPQIKNLIKLLEWEFK